MDCKYFDNIQQECGIYNCLCDSELSIDGDGEECICTDFVKIKNKGG